MTQLTPCVGCGALVPATDGPTHAYIGASPGCWAAYGEMSARQYAEFLSPLGQTTVDAYAAQHPGVPGRKQSQSVAVHLMSLCAVLERGLPPGQAMGCLTRYLQAAEGGAFSWLAPPASLGPLTVLDVAGARDSADFTARVERWARAVWQAWAPHHATVCAWLDRVSREAAVAPAPRRAAGTTLPRPGSRASSPRRRSGE